MYTDGLLLIREGLVATRQIMYRISYGDFFERAYSEYLQNV